MLGEYHSFTDEDREKVLALFVAYTKEHPIAFAGFLDEVRVAEKEERTSIVIRAEVANLAGFFTMCEQELGFHIPLTPSHVTLYTSPAEAGIGINTVEAWNALPSVEIPEITQTLTAK